MNASWSPESWTAAGTVALALAGVATCWVTVRLLRDAGIASLAANKAVDLAADAAQASHVANALKEAELCVSFKALFLPMGPRRQHEVMFTNEGVALWVHEVRVGTLAPHAVDGSHFELATPRRGAVCPLAVQSPPFRSHRGDHFSCLWPEDPAHRELGPLTVLRLELRYSFDGAGPSRSRDVNVEFPRPRDHGTERNRERTSS